MRSLTTQVGLAGLAVVLIQPACFDDSTPSSFTPVPEAGPEAAIDTGVADVLSDAPVLVTGDGASAAFPCNQTMCPTTYYCVITASDASAVVGTDCYPLLACNPGDCACVQSVVTAGYCKGDHVSCTASGGVIVTCSP